MRWLLLLLVLAGVGSWGYVRWFRADPIGEGDEIGKLGRDGASELGDPLVPPAPPPGGVEEEIRVLEDRLAGTTSPDGDRDRFRIASLLLVSDDADSITRGEEFLREIYRGDGEYAPRAAAALLQREEGEAAIEYARYIREAGPEASGYAEACLASGLERLRQGDEGASIEAWRLLSEAYFARQEASWRDAVRKELDPLVEALILSPRFNS
ncbi:MAG: hypothetical protein ACE5GW_03195, partial [Planctomycetota bacterium]